MDRNMRSSYVNSLPRSLPHNLGSKRHSTSNNARLSPPAPSQQQHQPPQNHVNFHNNNHSPTQHDDIIHYIYESWNKVTRDLERGGDEAKYYQEVMTPRQLANFRPFNLEEWWGRRVYSLKCNKHRS